MRVLLLGLVLISGSLAQVTVATDTKSKPATKPSTAPSVSPPMALAQSQIREAARAVELAEQESSRLREILIAAEAEVRSTLEHSDAFKALSEDTERKRLTLEESRKNGTARERVDASSAYNRAKNEVERFVTKGLSAAPGIAEQRKQASEAAKNLASRQKALEQANAALSSKIEGVDRVCQIPQVIFL